MNESFSTPTGVMHEPAAQRFVTTVDGLPGVADYRLQQGVMHMVHTEVHPRLQGRGVAASLVAAAFAHAQAEGLRVRPVCSYVHTYLRRHPEVAHLIG